MVTLNTDYLNNLIEISKLKLIQTFNLNRCNYSDFEIVNSFIVDNVLNSDKKNLLITVPVKEKVNDFLFQIILTSSLNCLIKNNLETPEFKESDILLSKKNRKIKVVKEVIGSQVRILPIGTAKRIDITNPKNYIFISKKFQEKIKEIACRETLSQRIKGNENLEKKLYAEYEDYNKTLSFLNSNEFQLPYKNKHKVVIVASKTEIISKVPSCIPFVYINKSGEVYPDTSFDPLLIVVNDFNTAKEFLIDKGVLIETILFIGNNKYQQSISSISKGYRQKKYSKCIFIGTTDIETGENFEVLKWNWTLPEIKFFEKKQYNNLTAEIISHPELSEATYKFTNFIKELENRYENLINLNKLLKFIRKIYPITAIGNENRIRERANEIFIIFESEAEDIFQEEYYNIDIDFKEDFDQVKVLFQNIINIIKNINAKGNWFKTTKEIDYIVVPKSIKKQCEKEISNCIKSELRGISVRGLSSLSELLNQTEQNTNQEYFNLTNVKVITVSEYLKKEFDGKTHFLFSLYGNGIYTEILLRKILSGNHNTKILTYTEEAKVLQMYMLNFQREDEIELHSYFREKICGLKYPDTQPINTENIDEWIQHLISIDEQKFTRDDDQKYEILFDDNTKTTERESKRVFVDGYEEFYKEINQLMKGDRVRIYHNPDKEILHDIIKMTDEKDLFTRVEYFSSMWKSALRGHFANCNHNFDYFFNELKLNGLSIDKPRLEYWLNENCKTIFPLKKRDLLAIIRTTNHNELNNNIQNIFTLKTTYSGRLVKAGFEFSEEINNYILTKEKGKMLDWLSNIHIEKIITNGAPLRTIKSIKLIDEEITD